MIRFGILLAVIGFGSIGFHYTDYQFRLLMWAEPMQPGIGAVVGIAGLALIGVALARKGNAPAQPAAQPTAQEAPGQYPQQAPAGPPQQYPAQQYPAQQYPQQQFAQQQYPAQHYPQQQRQAPEGYPTQR